MKAHNTITIKSMKLDSVEFQLEYGERFRHSVDYRMLLFKDGRSIKGITWYEQSFQPGRIAAYKYVFWKAKR